MDRKLLKFAGAVLAGAALVAPAWANPVDRSVSHMAVTGPHLKIGDKELDEGTYKFMATDNALTVESDGKVVAETPGRWVTLKDKAGFDSVIRYADGSVWQLRFRGEERVFVVSTPKETVKSSIH
jgi:hypothetical protein